MVNGERFVIMEFGEVPLYSDDTFSMVGSLGFVLITIKRSTGEKVVVRARIGDDIPQKFMTFDPKDIDIELRRSLTMKMFRNNTAQKDIAELLGVNVGVIHNDIMRMTGRR